MFRFVKESLSVSYCSKGKSICYQNWFQRVISGQEEERLPSGVEEIPKVFFGGRERGFPDLKPPQEV